MTIPIPRPRAATTTTTEEVTTDDLIMQELLRHGPSTAAELLAAIGRPPAQIIDRAIALVTVGVLRLTPDGQRFALRRRTR